MPIKSRLTAAQIINQKNKSSVRPCIEYMLQLMFPIATWMFDWLKK